MPYSIVVGYDGTVGANTALDEAIRLAGEIGATVHCVFAFSSSRLGGELKDLDDAIAERGAEVLSHAQEHASDAVREITTEFVKDDPAEALIRVADDRDARYIVVGSYGERPLKSALLGSTPTRLLHLSDRPVVVVRLPTE